MEMVGGHQRGRRGSSTVIAITIGQSGVDLPHLLVMVVATSRYRCEWPSWKHWGCGSAGGRNFSGTFDVTAIGRTWGYGSAWIRSIHLTFPSLWVD